MSRTLVSVLALSLCVSAVGQEPLERLSQKTDPTGTWVWEQNFRGNPLKRSITLKLDDGKLTGSFDSGFPPNSPPAPISNAKIKADKIWFQVVRDFGGRDFVTKFECVVTKDELGGISEVEFGGRVRETAFIATREKDPFPKNRTSP